MNNSKPSVTAPSMNTLTEPRSYDSRATWGYSPEDRMPSDSSRHNGYEGDDDSIRIESLNSFAVLDPPDQKMIKGSSQVEVKRLDLGLWLLCGSASRQSQWEHLQKLSQDAATVQESIMKWSSAIKRSCDIVGSLFFLAVLSPLFTLIAILIKLDSPGSVFFRHFRVGKDGKEFLLWKFRSMHVNVPKYAISPQSAADSRLTRIGRLIRRFSVDEIPQLINVLRGEMSLVGPRPEMPFIVDCYRSSEYKRFAVRPGITGLWQISPARAFPIHENLQYDFYYIHNQNLMLDCAIILRTITAVIHGIGAV